MTQIYSQAKGASSLIGVVQTLQSHTCQTRTGAVGCGTALQAEGRVFDSRRCNWNDRPAALWPLDRLGL